MSQSPSHQVVALECRAIRAPIADHARKGSSASNDSPVAVGSAARGRASVCSAARGASSPSPPPPSSRRMRFAVGGLAVPSDTFGLLVQQWERGALIAICGPHESHRQRGSRATSPRRAISVSGVARRAPWGIELGTPTLWGLLTELIAGRCEDQRHAGIEKQENHPRVLWESSRRSVKLAATPRMNPPPVGASTAREHGGPRVVWVCDAAQADGDTRHQTLDYASTELPYRTLATPGRPRSSTAVADSGGEARVPALSGRALNAASETDPVAPETREDPGHARRRPAWDQALPPGGPGDPNAGRQPCCRILPPRSAAAMDGLRRFSAQSRRLRHSPLDERSVP